MATLDFFRLSSPWTYLAFQNAQEASAEPRVEVDWRPFLVGGVFNSGETAGL